MDLRDRVALVTGAGGGLGSVIAKMLADQGAHIAVTHLGHRDERVEVCRQVEAKRRKSFLVHLDQTDPSSCESAVEATVKTLGRFDVLINNAAWSDAVPIQDLDALSLEIWDRSMNTNLRGPFLMTQLAAPHLKRQDQARIVNIAGLVGLRPVSSLRPIGIEGRPHPSDPLPCGGACADDHGELRRAGYFGRHPLCSSTTSGDR